jgi:hypothetical protein
VVDLEVEVEGLVAEDDEEEAVAVGRGGWND